MSIFGYIIVSTVLFSMVSVICGNSHPKVEWKVPGIPNLWALGQCVVQGDAMTSQAVRL